LAAQAGGLQPPAASADAFHHDAALVAWVTTRSSDDETGDEERFSLVDEPAEADSSPLDALDTAFELLSAA
jgi:hypothetical protein